MEGDNALHWFLEPYLFLKKEDDELVLLTGCGVDRFGSGKNPSSGQFCSWIDSCSSEFEGVVLSEVH